MSDSTYLSHSWSRAGLRWSPSALLALTAPLPVAARLTGGTGVAVLAFLGGITGISTKAFLPAGRALILCAGTAVSVAAATAVAMTAAAGAVVIYADRRRLSARAHGSTAR